MPLASFSVSRTRALSLSSSSAGSSESASEQVLTTCDEGTCGNTHKHGNMPRQGSLLSDFLFVVLQQAQQSRHGVHFKKGLALFVPTLNYSRFAKLEKANGRLKTTHAWLMGLCSACRVAFRTYMGLNLSEWRATLSAATVR